MNKHTITACLLFVIFLAGCATKLSSNAMAIRDADALQMLNCRYVGDVDGTSGFGNLAASTGINNAKNEARENAAHLGATHIVWTTVSGGYSPYVSGKAYQCK